MLVVKSTSILILITGTEEQWKQPFIGNKTGTFRNAPFASSDAITKTVALTANADWSIDQNFTESEWAWCSVTPTYGSAGTTTLTVDIQANGYDKRIHDFSIRSGDTDILLTIEQKQVVSF